MRFFKCKFSFNHIKRIPSKTKWVWFLLGVAVIYCAILLFQPVYHSIEHMESSIIHIEEIHLIDSHNTKGTRNKLLIVSDTATYYLWYPQNTYLEYKPQIEGKLLSGTETTVYAKLSTKQSIFDSFCNRYRIVDLRSESTVYYDISTEQQRLQLEYWGLWLTFLMFALIWICFTLYSSLVYGVLVIESYNHRKR